MRGTVKFWKSDEGWGAVMSDALPPGEDAFAHFSAVQADGWRDLTAGDEVEFEAVPTRQDSFNWTVERVRFLQHGPAPTLRRHGDRVDVAPDDEPDTPLTPRRR